MRNSYSDKVRRPKAASQYPRDPNRSDANIDQIPVTQRCSSHSSSSANKYEKQIMQRGYQTDKKQSHRRKTDSSAEERPQTRRSRTRTKVPNLRGKKSPIESDSFYKYTPPSPKPSVENIPNASHYKHTSQDDDLDRRHKDSDDEPRFAKYYRNIDDNLNYNRFNPNHNIHNNVSISKRHVSLIRSRTGSNNLLSLQEYNKMLNNDSQNSYGYFHGDKNNKLCYISNRPVYYDNSSISETMRYRKQHNEQFLRNNSDLRMVSKSDTSLAQPTKYGQNQRSNEKNDKEKVQDYLSSIERSLRRSHHNEKSLLDIDLDKASDDKAVRGKNSEITRLTNEIAKKLQNIGLNIHANSEPSTRSKNKRRKDGHSESDTKTLNPKETSSKDSCKATDRKEGTPSVSRLQGDETDPETGRKKGADSAKGPSRTSKYKQHSKYYVSNPDINQDNCLCHDPSSPKPKGLNGCCFREGEHMNLKQELLNCCNPRDGRNINEYLDVCDVKHAFTPNDEHLSKLLPHNLTKIPSCSCAFNELKCECGTDFLTKYNLYRSKRSRSPLTAVNKKTNGVYVFVPLPENSNDPLEMRKHLQNIYNNIIPQNDEDKKNGKENVKGEGGENNPQPDVNKGKDSEKSTATPKQDLNENTNKVNTDAPEGDSEAAKVKLINQLLDDYNVSLIKQLIAKKSPLKGIISREDILEDLKKIKRQSFSRRHSDLNLNLEQGDKTNVKPKKCPSESSFVMRLTGKAVTNLNDNDKYSPYNRFRANSPEQTSAFKQLQQQNPMFYDQPLSNYQSINLPFQEFVSDLGKFHSPPQGNGQTMFYNRNKSPRSYHGQTTAPPPVPPMYDSKPGQPLAGTIMDPTIQFQSKINADASREMEGSVIYSRPKTPSQTFNFGLDNAMKKHHQQLMHHVHSQSRAKPNIDTLSEPVGFGKAPSMASYYPPPDPTYGMQSHMHSGLYDIQESVDYSPTRFDYSPTRFERNSIYNRPDFGHQHRQPRSQYHYKTVPDIPGYQFDLSQPLAQTCQNHSYSQPHYKMSDHYHGDRSQYVDFHDRVQFIDTSDQSRGVPSIMKKLHDVVVKPFSLLFKVEPASSNPSPRPPRSKTPHLRGILKPSLDADEDEEPNEFYYHRSCGGGSDLDKMESRNTSNFDDMDLDSISQPPMEYVTVVDPFQTDSFESMHDDEKRYGDSASIDRNVKSTQSP